MMVSFTTTSRENQKWYINCCLDENIEILKCAANTKCEYAMCQVCIQNLKLLTEQDKCPACREEIFKSEEDEEDIIKIREVNIINHLKLSVPNYLV